MSAADTIAAVRLFVALVAVTTLVGVVLHRSVARALPYSIALVVAGLVLGLALPDLNATVSPQLVLIVILPGLVFGAAHSIHFDELRRAFGGVALLAAPGVIVAAVVVAIVLELGTGLPLELGFVVGAMVAATDPAAVISAFARLPTPARLDMLVEGESLFNDGTGLVAFAIALQIVAGTVTPAGVVIDFVVAIVTSGAIGAIVGFVASRLMAAIDDHLLEVSISLAAAYGTYLIADGLHQSGVIATVVAGVVIGNYGRRVGMTPTTVAAVDTVWEFIAFLLTALVFLLVGLAIPVSSLLDALPWIVWAIVGALLGRALVTYGMLGLGSRLRYARPSSRPIPLSWLHVIFWSGLRGAVSVAVALSLPLDFPQRTLLQEITFGVVLFTLVFHGTTIGYVVRRSGALDEAVGEADWAAPAAVGRTGAGEPAPPAAGG